jgi:unsaturated chondroitin disaccharide hydrolase
MALCNRHEPREAYRTAFADLLDFYLQRLPGDLVPFWDLIFIESDGEPRDSSSAAIVACGLLDMADQSTDDRAAEHRDLARRMIGALARDYAVRNPSVSNGQILHGTYSKKSPYNTCRGEGVDECVSWGDYYYFEALTRLTGSWSTYW